MKPLYESHEMQFLKQLTELTETFPLSGPDDKLKRVLKLKELLGLAVKMAKRKFYEMPVSFRETHPVDFWINEALLILFVNLVPEYNPAKDVPFDKFVGWRLPRRLENVTKIIFKDNPPVDNDLYLVIQNEKRRQGQDPSAESISDLTGRSIEDVRNIMERGFSLRVVKRADVGELESIGEASDYFTAGKNMYQRSPETQYIQMEERREVRMILWECYRKMTPYLKVLFVQRFLEERSCESLAKTAFFKRTARQIRKDAIKARKVLISCVENKIKKPIDLTAVFGNPRKEIKIKSPTLHHQ
ncbi:MAG: hypothetical protein QF466_10745 [Desulfobacterales bacterium]|nr:hypothetical protein [Desulfobacterales bacterium]MDP6683339.1 hypothetical protein [Desulfobacterales bacterium]MDP6807402.1 hypothetical protein [Desulfobacterales bacterium]